MESIAQVLQERFNKIIQSFKNFSAKYDVESWPGFLMFLVVVTLGVSLNYLTLCGAIGDFPALMVSLIFEIGIMAWKIQSWRRRNSVRQYEIANIATWLLVLLGIVMVVVNLFRATLQKYDLAVVQGVSFDSWTIAAYSIIGMAALIHVVSYLTFDQADSDKKQKREEQKLEQKNRNVNNALKNAETDLRIIHKIANEITKLRERYAHLPVNELEFVLEQTRLRLLKEYRASDGVAKATQDFADVNQDGKIGEGKPVKQKVQTLRQPAYASTAALVYSDPTPANGHKPITLDDFLTVQGITKDRARAKLKGQTDPNCMFKIFDMEKFEYISGKNARRLFHELQPENPTAR